MKAITTAISTGLWLFLISATLTPAQEIRLEGEVIDANGQPVPEASVYGFYLDGEGATPKATTDAKGKFFFKRKLVPAALMVYSKDRSLAGVIVSRARDEAITIEALPFITITGQLLDGESGVPLVETDIVYQVEYKTGRGATCFHQQDGKTDENGFFKFDQVIVGGDAAIHLVRNRGPTGMALSFTRVLEFDVIEREDFDLGKISPPADRKPLTIEQRAARMFVDAPLKPRFELAVEIAKLSRRNILIVSSPQDDPRLIEFLKQIYEHRKIRDWRAYRTLVVDPKGPHGNELKSLGVKKLSGEFSMHLFGSDRKLIETRTIDQLLDAEQKLNVQEIVDLLSKHVVAPLDARELLDKALATAKQENKRIFFQFTSSSRCQPCDQLTLFLDKNRIWEKDFIWLMIDTRWENAGAVVKETVLDLPRYTPWFAILDAEGTVMIDSEANKAPNLDYDERRNVGFPVKSSEKYYFKKMLMDTKIRLTEREIDDLILALGRK